MKNERAIEVIKNFLGIKLGFLSDEEFVAIELAIKALEERTKGEWIALYENDGTPKGYKCPYCDDEPQIINTNFCPNCGADMRGEEK